MMDAAVVYESMFGNTREVAEAIAAGIREADPSARVTVARAGTAKLSAVAEAGLLVVGGPTHIMRMSSPRTRQQGLESTRKATGQPHHATEPGAEGPGVREWLKALPPARSGSRAAAFDTRLEYRMAGGAARSVARQLHKHGYQLAAAAEGFIVTGAEGPLRDGEIERARNWGATLAGPVGVPGRG
jgi:Flavodoxin